MFGTLSRTRHRVPVRAAVADDDRRPRASSAATSQMRSAGSPRSTRVRVATSGNRVRIRVEVRDGVGGAIRVHDGAGDRTRAGRRAPAARRRAHGRSGPRPRPRGPPPPRCRFLPGWSSSGASFGSWLHRRTGRRRRTTRRPPRFPRDASTPPGGWFRPARSTGPSPSCGYRERGENQPGEAGRQMDDDRANGGTAGVDDLRARRRRDGRRPDPVLRDAPGRTGAAVPTGRRRRRRRAREPRTPADRRADRLPPSQEPAGMAPHRRRSRHRHLELRLRLHRLRDAGRGRGPPRARPSSTGSRRGRWSLAFASLPLLLLLFPTGKLHSRRWRPVLWASLACGSLLIVGAFAAATVAALTSNVPLADDAVAFEDPRVERIFTVMFAVLFIVAALTVVALVATLMRFHGVPGRRAPAAPVVRAGRIRVRRRDHPRAIRRRSVGLGCVPVRLDRSVRRDRHRDPEVPPVRHRRRRPQDGRLLDPGACCSWCSGSGSSRSPPGCSRPRPARGWTSWPAC